MLGVGSPMVGAVAVPEGAIAQALRDQTSKSKALLTQAKAQYRRAEFRQAIGLYQQILASSTLEPDSKIDALLGWSEILLGINQTQQVEENLQQALKIAREIRDRSREGEVLAMLGWAARSKQDYSKSQEYLNQSLTIAQQIGNKRGEARSLLLLGTLQYFQGTYPKALETFQLALKVAQANNNQDEVTHIYDWMATIDRELKNFKAAEDLIENQIALSRSIGYRTAEIDGLFSSATLKSIQNQPEPASRLYQQALELAQSADNPWVYLILVREVASIQVTQKETDQALALYQKALTMAQTIDEPAVADIYNRMGVAYSRSEQYPKALEAYQQALKIYSKTTQKSDTAQVLSNIGYSYKKQKRHLEGIKSYQQALSLYESLGNQAKQSETLSEIGDLYLSKSNTILNEKKDYPQAKQLASEGTIAFQRQLAIAEKMNDRIQIFHALIGIGQAYDKQGGAVYRAGQYPESLHLEQQALSYKQKALKIVEELKDLERIKSAQYAIEASYYGLINTYNEIGETAKALESLDKARKIAQIVKNPKSEQRLLRSEMTIYLTLSNTYTDPVQYPEKLKNNQKIIALSKQLNQPDTEAVFLNLTAQIHYFWGQYDRALEVYQQVLTLARSIDDYQLESLALLGIGQISQVRADYPQALTFIQQSLEIGRTRKIKRIELVALNNMVDIYKISGKYSEALSYNQKSFDLIEPRYEIFSKGVTIESMRLECLDSYNFRNIGSAKDKPQSGLSLACNEPIVIPTGSIFDLFKGSIAGSARQMRFFMGNNFNNLGTIYNNQGDYSKAIELYRKSVEIFRKIKDKPREALSLNNLSAIYSDQGNYSLALPLAEQALAMSIEQKNPISEITYRTNLAAVYSAQGNYPKALEANQQALALAEKLRTPLPKSVALRAIGNIYNYQGKYAEALSFMQQSLTIEQEIGNPSGVIMTQTALSKVYYKLGQTQKALDLGQAALALTQKIGSSPLEITALENIAGIYLDQGDLTSAQEAFQKALDLANKIESIESKSLILFGMAKVQSQQNQPQLALNLFQQALQIQQKIGVKRAAAQTLNRIGQTQTQLNSPEANASLQSAIVLAQSIGDIPNQAYALANLADLATQKNQSELAIVFYKQSVSLYESIRLSNRTLPKDQQEIYTKTVEKSYRDLADLLLKNDRILEAQQVLDLLKVQELNTYLKNVRGANQPIETLPPETEILKKYSAIQTNAIALGQELSTLRQTPEPSRSTQQTQRITQLDQLQRELNQQFNGFTDRTDIKTLIEALSPKVRRQTIDTADLNALRTNLKQLNAVMIYPLILDDRLELIITTPDSPPLRRTVNVKREDLNKAILDFRMALERNDDRIDRYAQKLYAWLIKPLEADLKISNPKTLIYAPDGQLRYIPIAALHDGKQWLIERYAINHITAKSLTNFTQQPQQQPKILAGAIGGKASEGTKVTVGTRSFDFAGLPGTNIEIDRIQALQPTTQILKETAFTLPKLLPKFADYNILHLATHAAIVPGNPEDSFILFGGKTTATLKEIENWDLSSFDLVILSACQTGLAGNFGTNGEEVLGLGYQFQNRGAKATIASLWKVDDNSTQQLMTEFYHALKAGKTKNQALQSAQLALISGTTTKTKGDRSDLEVQHSGKESSKNAGSIDAPHRHPYYWAPFILIGNGL